MFYNSMAKNDTITPPRRKRGALVHPAGGAAPPGGRERDSKGKTVDRLSLWRVLTTLSRDKVVARPALGQNVLLHITKQSD